MIFGNGCDNAGDSTVECRYEITQESRVVVSHECGRKLEGYNTTSTLVKMLSILKFLVRALLQAELLFLYDGYGEKKASQQIGI